MQAYRFWYVAGQCHALFGHLFCCEFKYKKVVELSTLYNRRTTKQNHFGTPVSYTVLQYLLLEYESTKSIKDGTCPFSYINIATHFSRWFMIWPTDNKYDIMLMQIICLRTYEDWLGKSVVYINSHYILAYNFYSLFFKGFSSICFPKELL